MDLPCPSTHFRRWGFGAAVICTIPQCPRYGFLAGPDKAAEIAPESEEVRTASKQQKATQDLYREATQMAAEHGTLPERLRALKEEVKKIAGSQGGAYLNGMPQIQPISQEPGFARERVDWYHGHDFEHDKSIGWQPNASADFNFTPPQSNTVPYNKNQMLPDFPGPFVLEQSTMGGSQADTFTDFALPSSRQRHLRKLPFALPKGAFCTGEGDGWSSGICSNEPEVEFTPESTPEQEEFHAINAPAEASKVKVQPDPAHLKLDNAPGKPVYQFVPFRNVPRIINEGTSEDSQRSLEVSSLLGYSGPAHPESSEPAGKHRPGLRPVRNDYKTNSSGSGPVRRDAMTFATGDLKKKIEKVARYVARSGPKFEEVVRSKNQGTDIVSFLEPTNTYHTYYKWRVAQCKDGNTYDIESEELSAETDSWSEHINSDGRQHWYNKVSHEFVWDKPLVLVAEFQPRKEIGLDIEKRELDFLGDCVKFLPFPVRSKAIAVVDKLQNIAYGALSDELPAEKEDDATKKLQKFEAALKLVENKHTETESALLKRIEELEGKQGPQMPEATATKLNTLYDKLGHIVDHGVQHLESGRKSDQERETIVFQLQQRIEELESKHASQNPEDTVDRLETLKIEFLETHSSLLKHIQRVESDLDSRLSELAATQSRSCEWFRDIVDERVRKFGDERTSIGDEHKETMSALSKRTEELEMKQSSEIPELIRSQLSELFGKLEGAEERLSKFDAGVKLLENKQMATEAALQERIEKLVLENKQIELRFDASSSELQNTVAAQTVLQDQIAKLEADREKPVDAVARVDDKASKAFDHAKLVGDQAAYAQTNAEKALEGAVKAHNLASRSREAGAKTIEKTSELPKKYSWLRDHDSIFPRINQIPVSERPLRNRPKVESRLERPSTPDAEGAVDHKRLERKAAGPAVIPGELGRPDAGSGPELVARRPPRRAIDHEEAMEGAWLYVP